MRKLPGVSDQVRHKLMAETFQTVNNNCADQTVLHFFCSRMITKHFL